MGFYNGYAATMLNTFSNRRSFPFCSSERHPSNTRTEYAYFFFYTLVRTSYIRRLANRRKAHHGSGSKTPALSTAAELILGAVAGGLSQIFTIPVSVIALRQQIYRSKGVPSSALAARRNGAKKELPLNGATSANKSYAQAVKQPSPDALASEEHSRSRHERHSDSNSFTDVARRIIKEEGVAGLWLGLKPSLVLTVNPAITYGAFERIKGLLLLSQFAKGISSGGKLSPGTAFLLGALSKTLATIVGHFPFADKKTPESIIRRSLIRISWRKYGFRLEQRTNLTSMRMASHTIQKAKTICRRPSPCRRSQKGGCRSRRLRSLSVKRIAARSGY
jgi:adenine nucleotide transporter 17